MKRRLVARRDSNHDAIANDFRELGCSVADLENTGVEGWPDIGVGCVGVTHLVEIKNPDTAYGRAGLSKSQSAFARDWRGGPIYVARTRDDVVALVQEWRREARQ